MPLILMTTLFNKAIDRMILQEEIWCWSLLGLKRLSAMSQIFGLKLQILKTGQNFKKLLTTAYYPKIWQY